MMGISIVAFFGFINAMQYPDNEVLIGITLAITGGAGVSFLPLMNELKVETTYPVGAATSTGVSSWLSGPLSGVLTALSSLVPFSDANGYSNSVCRDGESQDLSWFLLILSGVGLVYYLLFVYFYRIFD